MKAQRWLEKHWLKIIHLHHLISVFYFWFSNLIGKNNIGDEGAKIIGEALMKNNSLTLLNLGILLLNL